MQFRQKLQIVRAMRKDGKSGMLWNLIQLLTDLRNQTAHGRLEKNVEDRIATVESIRNLLPKSEDRSRTTGKDIVLGAFAYATSGLGAIIEGIEEGK